MAAILRIRQHRGHGPGTAEESPSDPVKAYVDRLVKLVPAEVVGLYLAGKAMIQTVHPAIPPASGGAPVTGQGYWIGWTLFCLAAVVLVRAWATSDRRTGTPVEWPAVAIATVSFGVWVYSMGDAFAQFEGLWEPLLASLLVVGWTFAAPLIYGEPTPPTPQPPTPPVPAGLRADRREYSTVGAGRPTFPAAGPAGPKAFTEGDAEQAVLGAAERRIGRRPSLSEKVKDAFTDASQVRDLMGAIQDAIANVHGIWVDLASGSDQEMNDLGKLDYRALSSWVFRKVIARSAAHA